MVSASLQNPIPGACNSAFFLSDARFWVRASGRVGAANVTTEIQASEQIVCRSGVKGIVPPRRFYRRGNAAGVLQSRFLGALVQHPQKSASRLCVSLDNLSFVTAVHEQNSMCGKRECPPKEFPKPEKMFPRTT